MIAPPATRRNEDTELSRAMTVWSVSWIWMPVSPVAPLIVMEVLFPEGGTMVTAVGVDPPDGTVMVLSPDDRVLISTDPGLELLEAALRTSVPTTSEE